MSLPDGWEQQIASTLLQGTTFVALIKISYKLKSKESALESFWLVGKDEHNTKVVLQWFDPSTVVELPIAVTIEGQSSGGGAAVRQGITLQDLMSTNLKEKLKHVGLDPRLAIRPIAGNKYSDIAQFLMHHLKGEDCTKFLLKDGRNDTIRTFVFRTPCMVFGGLERQLRAPQGYPEGGVESIEAFTIGDTTMRFRLS